MRVENMTDREIVAACAVDFRRKAQEAYDAYQSTGMMRYDNAYHKYEALADALDRDVQKADTRQAAASIKSELIMLASAASRAKLPSAPEGALLALAKKDALVMHPGPMNRGVEIASSVADCGQSVITQQVESGVAVRMALLYMLTRRENA